MNQERSLDPKNWRFNNERLGKDGGKDPIMLIHDFVLVEEPIKKISSAVLDGKEWLGQNATQAYRDAERLRIKVGPKLGSKFSAKEVVLFIGNYRQARDSYVIPLTWEATGTPGLFPTLKADLLLAPIGDVATQITLTGSYEPPLGQVGQRLDQLLLHRLAETTIRSFLIGIKEFFVNPVVQPKILVP